MITTRRTRLLGSAAAALLLVGLSAGQAAASVPEVGRGADGRFGDNRQGPAGALVDSVGLSADPNREETLRRIDAGTLSVHPESRLGAYAATVGYPTGSVGCAVHSAIGDLYRSFGTAGEEKVGRVFRAAEAVALFDDPVSSPSGLLLAEIEHKYWTNVLVEDPFSPGGALGTAFLPGERDWLQQNVFCGIRP